MRIRNPNQPLAISKSQRTGKEIALIPELCHMTGLTESMRANFNLMKDVNQVLQRGPQERIADIRAFAQDLQNQRRVRELIDQL